MAPQPNALAAMASRVIGLEKNASGISGYGAVNSRHTNAAAITSASANSARIGGAVQG